MSTSNSELMKNAEESLSGKWGLAVGTFFVIIAINIAIQMMSEVSSISSLISIIISGPLTLGIAIFSLNISRGNEMNSNQIFEGHQLFVYFHAVLKNI